MIHSPTSWPGHGWLVSAVQTAMYAGEATEKPLRLHGTVGSNVHVVLQCYAIDTIVSLVMPMSCAGVCVMRLALVS